MVLLGGEGEVDAVGDVAQLDRRWEHHRDADVVEASGGAMWRPPGVPAVPESVHRQHLAVAQEEEEALAVVVNAVGASTADVLAPLGGHSGVGVHREEAQRCGTNGRKLRRGLGAVVPEGVFGGERRELGRGVRAQDLDHPAVVLAVPSDVDQPRRWSK